MSGNMMMPYVIAIIIELIYTGAYVISKAALDQGINAFVFTFYRQAAASLLLLPIALVSESRAFMVAGVTYYLQVWCVELKGPVFLAMWQPLLFVFTVFCSSFFLGENVYLGSIIGGALLVGGLYSVLWGKSKEPTIVPHSDVNMTNDVIQGEMLGHHIPQGTEKTTLATAAEQV